MRQDRLAPADAARSDEGVQVCTIAASWPSTVRLVDTVRAHHPTRPIWVLALADPGSTVPAQLDATILTPADLSLDPVELAELRLVYSAEEVVGALVPRLLRALLARGAGRIVHLADAFEVHAPLSPIDVALDKCPTALWRRATRPLPDDDLEPSEASLLLEGNVHPGHVAVGDGSGAFLDWWAAHTRWDAGHDTGSGLWGAGRWLELAADLFDLELADGDGCAIGAAGLGGATLGGSPGAFTVDGVALCTFDTTGLDPEQPDVLDIRAGTRARVLATAEPALDALLHDRADAMAAIGDLGPCLPTDRFDALVRGMARAELRSARRAGRAPGFTAGTPGEIDLVRWLSTPVAHPGTPISRLLHAVAVTRPDLRTHFPHPLAGDGPGLAAWATGEPDFPASYGDLQIAPSEPDRRLGAIAPGFNIVGYLHGELGLGEAGRLMARAAARAGVPFAPIAFSETASRQGVEFEGTVDGAPYETTLLCVNADLTPLASARTWGALDHDRHRIGYWFWEVDRFPAEQASSAFYVDELWAASGYVADVLGAATDKPVRVIPHPVAEPVPTHLTREDLGLSDRFTFAFWFDAFSGVERKNPAGLVEAFCRAFAPDEGPMLLLKAINGAHDRAAMRRLHRLAGDRSDIAIVDEYWTGAQMRALVQHVDCYVSLHRSEGFGQTMADAMAAGTPVIATAHSGNLEFMTDENSHLVPATLVPVGADRPPYPPDARWAAPDLDVAAALMRRVLEHPSDAAAKSALAVADIRRHHGIEVTAAHLLEELERRLVA
ncbi:MAG: glycosyltransferase [Acidimicrobiales bacterium]